MRHDRLWRSLLLVIVTLGLLLTTCGGDGEETPAAEGERGTIRFAVYDWEQATYDDLIEAFEEANPGLHVQLVSINETLGLAPMGAIEWPDDAELRLVSAADVVNIGVSRRTVQEGLVRDLTPFIKADPNFHPEDFYPNILENYQWDGGVWALPTTASFQLIFYDKDAFDEAGEPYPELGWTWHDFLAKARALTAREGDKVTRWGFVQSWPSPWPFIEGRVGPLVDDTTDPPTPRFDQPEVIEAVRWYADLYLREQVTPYFEPPGETEGPAMSEGQKLIDKGQAAMWPEVSAMWWWRNEQGNVGVAPYPGDTPDARTTPIWTRSLSMSAGTTQPDAAWRWLNFLSRQPIESLGPMVQSLPPRRSVAETSGFWDNLDEELAGALRYAIDHSYVMHWTTGQGVLSDAMETILSGEESVEEALAEAQVQAKADIQEELTQQAEATPVSPFVVAPPEEEGPVSEDTVTITFVPGIGSFNLQTYRDLAKGFHEEYPAVVVEIKMPDYTSAPDLQSMAKAADCFQWYPSFQNPEERVAILSLEPFLDADPSLTTDDFYPSVLKQFTWQGQLWGLPAEVGPYVVEYNEDLFDAAGVDYPALDWTTDDFLALAVALTRGEGEGKQYGFVAQVHELTDLQLMVERLGSRLIDESVDPLALSFNDPATVEAVRWYADLSTVHGVKPVFVTDFAEAATSSYVEREEMINDGRAAMWTSYGPAMAFGERRELNVGVVPLPAGPDGTGGGGYLTASGYFISAQTENRRACWQWITFLTAQPTAVQGLPARRSLAESDEYRQQVGAERAAAYLASVAGSEQPSTFQFFYEEEWLGGSFFWFGQAYGRVLEGEASVEEALDAAQEMADDYRACIIAHDAFSDREQSRACLREADPTLPDSLFGPDEEEER
ncbi:MAG: extracellular solute-binding protein [Chloroflexota bacterium]|nr:extracellular solute-binding protein [Chloroflexota bacterium]